MVNQSLVMYIQNSVRQGMDINNVRNQLIQQGYNPYEVDSAINFLYSGPTQVHHTISLSKSAIIGIIAMVIALSFAGYLAYFLTSGPEVPKKLLDFETSALKTAVKPGENLAFTIRLFNMGSAPRYDVSVISVVLDEKKRQVAKKEDTFAVEKRTAETMQVNIPSSASPGAYTLQSTATYSNGKASSSFEFTVYQDSASPTCFDNKQNQGEKGVDCGDPCRACPSCNDKTINQGETGVDCGGPCKACEEGCLCDDGNICTDDYCDNGKCINEDIVPCCGNGICEDEADCPDCAEETPSQIIERAREQAIIDPESAVSICSTLRELRDKDRCFDVVAKNVSQSAVCNYIASTANRDACYMHFAMRFDFSVCEKVENPYLQKSCDSLKYIKASD